MAEPEVHTVAEVEAGQTLAKLVRTLGGDMPWSRARSLCASGRVLVNEVPQQDPAVRVAAGDTVEVRQGAPRQRKGVLDTGAIVHLDRDFVIVNKPPGLITVPYAPTDRDTLVDITRARVRRMDSHAGGELGVVQRLDKETSGLLVFTRTLAAKRNLQQQWRVHDIERRYSAIVHGSPRTRTVESHLIQNRGDGLRGSHGLFRRAAGPPPREARRALTHVRVLRQLTGAALVECQLETGRQHQIRIHLSEDGHPLLGERVYVRGFKGPMVEAPRVMLHARVLGFAHPRSGKPVRFELPPPDDFEQCLAGLEPAPSGR